VNPTATSRRPRLTSLRMRPDLIAFAQTHGTSCDWVLKDPVRLHYFHFSEEEYWVIQALDGYTSFAEIRSQFERNFSPIQLSKERLQSFLSNLHRQGLLLSEGEGQASVLKERGEKDQKSLRNEFWSNPLAIRFPGFDPDRLLTWLYPAVRFVFSPVALFISLLVVATAIGLLFAQSEHLSARLPSLTAFINAENLVLLVACLAGIKALHEFGHALVCKHFGGECHELGVMLLVFTPCLYCNVTDSWILRNRWQRIAISAAGIAIEVLLAAFATFGWWYSRPGVFNSVCLNVMIVSSVSTILINANPLLRYDGYYILSDLIGIPNLWQEARTTGRRFLARIMWGPHSDEMLRRPKQDSLLIIYAGLSIIYRVVLITSILWFLYVALKPLRMEIFVFLLAALIALRSLIATGRCIHRNLQDSLMASKIQSLRSLVVLTFVVGASWGLFILPVPCHIEGHVVLKPINAQRIYTVTRGLLREAMIPGQTVSTGDVIARLENPELALEIVRLEGQLRLTNSRLSSLSSRVFDDDTVAAGLVVTQEIIEDLQQQLEQRQSEAETLVMRSPRRGVIMTSPQNLEHRTAGTLVGWARTPLDSRNIDCNLERGTLICLVGDSQNFEAMLYVNEWDLEFVKENQNVRLSLDALPGHILIGKVREVAQRKIEVVPRELVAGQKMPGRPDQAGIVHPLDSFYRVRIALDEQPTTLYIGALGRGKIIAHTQTLGGLIHRYLRQTFASQAAF